MKICRRWARKRLRQFRARLPRTIIEDARREARKERRRGR